MLSTWAITIEGLTIVMHGPMLRGMDIQQNRLGNLQGILSDRFNGVIARLAAAIGKDPNQTRFILFPEKPGGRNIGEKLARQIEQRLSLAVGDLDREPKRPKLSGPYEQLTVAQRELHETLSSYLSRLDDQTATSLTTLIRATVHDPLKK